MANFVLVFNNTTGQVITTCPSLDFGSGFSLKVNGQSIVLGTQQGTISDATLDLGSVQSQLNLLLAACRNFGLLDVNQSSSSSSSSSFGKSVSSSSSSVMGCCGAYDFEGATSDVLSNGIYNFTGTYNSRPYFNNGSRYLFYRSSDGSWLINNTVSELSPKYYSDVSYALCPEGQYRWGGNDSLEGIMYCEEASSTSSVGHSSSSSNSSSSSTELKTTSSTSSSSTSLYGCEEEYIGSGFASYPALDSMTLSFSGWSSGRPAYSFSFYSVVYSGSNWRILNTGTPIYIETSTRTCPYGDYKLISSGLTEGSLTTVA